MIYSQLFVLYLVSENYIKSNALLNTVYLGKSPPILSEIPDPT